MSLCSARYGVMIACCIAVNNNQRQLCCFHNCFASCCVLHDLSVKPVSGSAWQPMGNPVWTCDIGQCGLVRVVLSVTHLQIEGTQCSPMAPVTMATRRVRDAVDAWPSFVLPGRDVSK